jgi:hypothetical protein
VRQRPRFIATAVLAGAVGSAFVVGQHTATNSAQAAASRTYTLRVGDRAAIPAVGQVCSVYLEGGAPELFCAKPRGARHQVTFFRGSILAWRVGNPGDPVWSGKP